MVRVLDSELHNVRHGHDGFNDQLWRVDVAWIDGIAVSVPYIGSCSILGLRIACGGREFGTGSDPVDGCDMCFIGGIVPACFVAYAGVED